MDNQTQTMGNDQGTIVAGPKVGEAHKRLDTIMEKAKEIRSCVREQAVQSAKVADQTIHKNPYQAIGIALGVGALIGYLASRRSARNGD